MCNIFVCIGIRNTTTTFVWVQVLLRDIWTSSNSIRLFISIGYLAHNVTTADPYKILVVIPPVTIIAIKSAITISIHVGRVTATEIRPTSPNHEDIILTIQFSIFIHNCISNATTINILFFAVFGAIAFIL